MNEVVYEKFNRVQYIDINKSTQERMFDSLTSLRLVELSDVHPTVQFMYDYINISCI